MKNARTNLVREHLFLKTPVFSLAKQFSLVNQNKTNHHQKTQTQLSPSRFIYYIYQICLDIQKLMPNLPNFSCLHPPQLYAIHMGHHHKLNHMLIYFTCYLLGKKVHD